MNSFNTFQSLLLCSKKLLPKKLLEKILFHHKEDIFILFGKNYNDSFFLCEYNCTKNSYKVLTNTIDFEVRDILRLDENNLLLVSYDTLKIYNTQFNRIIRNCSRMNIPRDHYIYFKLSKELIFISGGIDQKDGTDCTKCEIYNWITDKYEIVPTNINVCMYKSFQLLKDNRVLLIGKINNDVVWEKSVECNFFNIKDYSITSAPSLLHSKGYLKSSTIDNIGNVYFLSASSIQKYDFENNIWIYKISPIIYMSSYNSSVTTKSGDILYTNFTNTIMMYNFNKNSLFRIINLNENKLFKNKIIYFIK